MDGAVLNSEDSRETSQVSIWGMFGPILLAATLLSIVFRASTVAWGIPLSAVCGFCLCYYLSWRGAWISNLLLGGSLIYYLTTSPSEEWLWLTVLTLSFAVTMLVTVLSLAESRETNDIYSTQLQEQQQTILGLEKEYSNRYKLMHEELEEKKKALEKIKGNFTLQQGELRSAQNLLSLAKEELTARQTQEEKLLQELYETRQKAVDCEEQMEQIQSNPIVKNLSAYEANLSDMKQQVAVKEREMQEQRLRVESLNSDKQHLESSVQRLKSDLKVVELNDHQKQQYINELSQLHELELGRLKSELQQISEKAQQSTAQHDQRVAEHLEEISNLRKEIEVVRARELLLSQQCEELSQQVVQSKVLAEAEAVRTPADTREVRRLEGLYQQLREQFEEKSATLDVTRKELFYSQEQVAALQKDFEEYRVNGGRELEQQLSELMAAAEREVATIERDSQQEIESLHALVNSLMANKG